MNRARETLVLLFFGWPLMSLPLSVLDNADFEQMPASGERHAYLKRQETTLKVDPDTLTRTTMPGRAWLDSTEIGFEIDQVDHRLAVPLGYVAGQGIAAQQLAKARCGRRACSCRGDRPRCDLVCDLCWILLERN